MEPLAGDIKLPQNTTGWHGGYYDILLLPVLNIDDLRNKNEEMLCA